MSTVRLGPLTDAIRKADLPVNTPVKFSDDRNVGWLISWRGSYSELSLTSNPHRPVTYGELLNDLEQAAGGTFEGYKGGSYVMDGWSDVYADEEGDSTGLGIVGAHVAADGTLILEVFDPSQPFKVRKEV